MNIYCSNCENACSEHATWCEKCGRPLVAQQGPETAEATDPPWVIRWAIFRALWPIWLLVAICVGCALVLNSVIYPSPDRPRVVRTMQTHSTPITVGRHAATPPSPTKRLPECSDGTRQADGEKVIRRTIAQGYWTSVEWSGSSPKVWVTRDFLEQHYDQTPEEYEFFQCFTLAAVWFYWNCEREDFGRSGSSWDKVILVLDDGSQLGKNLGTYTPPLGIDWQ